MSPLDYSSAKLLLVGAERSSGIPVSEALQDISIAEEQPKNVARWPTCKLKR